MIRAHNRSDGILVKTRFDNPFDSVMELSAVIETIREQIIEDTDDEELAGMMITVAGELAYAKDDDEREKILLRFSDELEKKAKDDGLLP